jgi:hypothetical protein
MGGVFDTCPVRLVGFIYLVFRLNQINKTNQTNQLNKTGCWNFSDDGIPTYLPQDRYGRQAG